MKKMRIWGVFFVLTLLTACVSNNVDPGEESLIEGKIRIAYFSESDFYDDFGSVFKFFYPYVQIEVVPIYTGDTANTDEMERYLHTYDPDIMMLDRRTYYDWSNQGFLLNLEEMAHGDPIDFSVYLEPVLNALKADGGGYLYGISPFFRSNVLFYNKDLFDHYNIPYPQHDMSWDEVMALAARFATQGSTENGHYGLDHGFRPDYFRPFNLINTIVSSENLSYTDAEGKLSLMNNRIEELYRLVIDGLKLEAIRPPLESDEWDEFVAGHAAMRFEGYYMLEYASIFPFDWDIVSEPTTDGRSSNYVMDTIFVIPQSSVNPDLAWEFIAFTISDRFFELKTRSFGDFGFPIMRSMMNGIARLDKDLTSFYRHQSVPYHQITAMLGEDIPNFRKVADESAVRAVRGELSIEDSLEFIERKLQPERE